MTANRVIVIFMFYLRRKMINYICLVFAWNSKNKITIAYDKGKIKEN